MRINLAASIENSFTFVDRQHPFYPHIRFFKSLSLSHPDFLAKRIHTEGETRFQSYMKAHFVPDQGWKFKRLYFSIQSRNPLEPLFGFSAQTFSTRAMPIGLNPMNFHRILSSLPGVLFDCGLSALCSLE